MRRLAIMVAPVIAFAATAGHADAPDKAIAFHRIDREPVTSFATRFFYKRHLHAVKRRVAPTPALPRARGREGPASAGG
jgi:hypothetical protein